MSETSEPSKFIKCQNEQIHHIIIRIDFVLLYCFYSLHYIVYYLTIYFNKDKNKNFHSKLNKLSPWIFPSEYILLFSTFFFLLTATESAHDCSTLNHTVISMYFAFSMYFTLLYSFFMTHIHFYILLSTHFIR